MLLSLVIRMRAQAPGVLHPNQGRALYDIFLNWVGEFDAGLSACLHDSSGRKPFTISDLNGTTTNRRGEALFTNSQEVWWRVTSLSADLSMLLDNEILPAIKSRQADEYLVLGEKVPFRIIDMTTDASMHPWAGKTTCQELYEIHEKSEPADRLEMLFTSPTTFRSAEKHLPFPLPELVLGSWLEQWNNASNLYLLEDIRLFGRESVAISQYNLQTQAVHYDKKMWIGFFGQCSYRILSGDDYWRKLVNLLADFSFYCGTGAKTSFGMGQTRLL